MPLMDGIEATRRLAGPDVTDPLPIVVITTFDLDEYVHGALKAGARGFLLKDAGPALLTQAIGPAEQGASESASTDGDRRVLRQMSMTGFSPNASSAMT